jgi:hypothetical protein
MTARSNTKVRKRGKQSKVYARADASILVRANFHPIEEMVRTAQTLEGMDPVIACDKIARYFYPTKKAVEVEGVLDGDVRIILGGTDD